MFDHDKTMFEIYRESTYDRRYRVVYYTELHENNKEAEINRALAGETFYHGFIRDYGKEQAKQIIDALIQRLNNGELLTEDQVVVALSAHSQSAP